MNQPHALDRLLNKPKPKVPERVDTVRESVSLDVLTSRPQNTGGEPEGRAENPDTSSPDVETSVPPDTGARPSPDNFQTVRNTIRVDSAIDDPLRRLCQDERITRETWLEAAYLFLSERPDDLSEVIRVARERMERRKAIADYKRAKTMQERFLKS